MELALRNECEKDHREVEAVTRDAFWNLHAPGCDEHYLAHIMRRHQDFLPALDFVAVLNNRIVGNIMYAKSCLVNDNGFVMETLTFGPVSVLPEFQRKGIGSKLIRHTIHTASSLGCHAVVIEGHPHHYCKHGFVGSKRVNVSDAEGKYPYSLLVLELKKGCLKNHAWRYIPSDVYNFDETESLEFDTLFPKKEQGFRPSQEEYRIASNAYVL